MSKSTVKTKTIQEFDSLHKGYIESQSMACPQFYHREKCGCTFLHCLRNGVWESSPSYHRPECIWKH